MARIDLYLTSMEKFGASGMVLRSGAKVMLRFPAGDKYATQTLSHADIVAMVQETVPQEHASRLDRGLTVSYGYDFGGKGIRVTVTPQGSAWEVELGVGPAPSSQGAPAASHHPVAAAPAATHAVPAAPAATHAAPAPTAMHQAPPSATTHGSAAPPSPAPAASTSVTPDANASTFEKARLIEDAKKRATPVEALLIIMKELGASDLHLSTGCKPIVRLHGNMQILDDFPEFTAESMHKQLMEIAPEENRKQFAEVFDTDFAHSIKGVARFRANYFMDRMGPGAVFRTIPFEILSAEKLGIPRKVLELAYLTKGLVLVTGPTGSGKSTTLATLVDYVNQNRADHIITIEDPIEFVHQPKKCLVNQREIGTHTKSFKSALRAALREDPDIVLVGEMRDLETIAIAVETAETGHLVFGTLHTSTAPSTVDRIIDQFPADRQEQIRQMLSESLKGVISQTLCKKIGGGRIAAYEILLGTPAVANLIREGKVFQLFSLMQTQRGNGMLTLNDCLIDYVKKNLVEPKEAYMKAVNKSEFKSLLAKEGIKIEVTEE